MKALIAFIALFAVFIQLSVQQECDASKLCERGCCSSAGYCGYGPDYCGKGCQSTCDRKADCNPGWNSSDFSKWEKCPLNTCCSKHGFCGFTEEFCAGKEVKRPSCAVGATQVDRVIGYYEGWATAKRGCNALRPEEIPFGQYTHLIFSFATINPQTFEVSAGDFQTDDMMTRIGSMKIVQPDLKIWVAIGGWAFNDPGPTQTTFSDLAASESHTETFLNSLEKMQDKYGFDGVDIDWEYPVAPDRSGRGEDYTNIVTFMKKIRQRMDKSRRGVSMALPASYWYLQHFDIVKLEEHVDWFNLMTYDMHGSWDIDNQWTGPWANAHTNLTEIQTGLDLLWRNNISPSKVTMGMSYYARTFTLADPACSQPGCRVTSTGKAGKCSDTAGVLLHPEIQDIIAEKSLKPVLHRDAAVKTVSWGNQWTSFDDTVTWRLKVNNLRSQCITGFMVWAISQDDESGTNARSLASALGRAKFELPNYVIRLKKPDSPDLESKTCRWTSCFEGCPTGFKEVQRDGHKEIMMDTTPCMGKGHGFIRLCCPTSHDLPTCTWRGHRNTGKCKSGCKTFELEVGTLSAGCTKSGYQSACCTDTMVTSLYSKCVWTSCSKDPENACSGNNPHFLTSSSVGSGGMSGCKKGQKRSLCCVSPSPYDVSGKCEWRKKAGFLKDQELLCEGACSSDQLMLARESGLTIGNEGGDGCYGDLAFCCSEPKKQKPRSEDPGSSEGREFQALIRKYMENPTCPATILQPPQHDMFAGGRRSLDAESTEFDVLRGRAVDCALSNWVRLLQYATVIFTSSRSGMSALTKVWDDEFAGYFDKELAYDSLSGFLAQNRGYEPRSVLEWVLLNPTQAGPSIRGLKKATFALCQSPKIGPRSLSSNSSLQDRSTLVDRTIDAWRLKGEMGDTPRLNAILAAIMAGYLSLHYARWQWFSNNANGNVPGPFLELAYWIGDQPGVMPNNDMSEFQDLTYNPNRQRSDQWVVFHLHIDHNDPNWLMRTDGRTYVGIRSLTMYHGQHWQYERAGQWRVARQDGRLNVRSGFLCPQDTASNWYIGRNVEPLEGDDGDWATLLNLWGRRLYDQGYVSTPGLRMIISPPGNVGSPEVDPENPGTLSQGEGTPAVGGNNPYHFNFLLEHDGINLTPNPPPQDRQHPNQG